MSGVISIEGNLGAGKSTLLSMMGVSVIKEPVDEWQKTQGGSILEKYYHDPKRWAFTFQLHALHSRSKLWRKTIEEMPNIVHYSQRSPMADRHIFGEIMAREGNLDESEIQIYNSITQTMMGNLPIKAIIYLKCSPQVCLNRIKQRGRKGQESITLQYLHKVHQRHQQWISNQIKTMKVLTIDTDIHDIYNPQHKHQILRMVDSFTELVTK